MKSNSLKGKATASEDTVWIYGKCGPAIIYIPILKYTGKDDLALFGDNLCRIIGLIVSGSASAQKLCYIRRTSLVDWSLKMRTVLKVFLLLKAAQKKLYDDIFVLISHIRLCTSCDGTIVHAHIAISVLKLYIVQAYC